MDSVITVIVLTESIATIGALLIAGVIAWRNGIIFRHRSPHINITHDITHREISPNYTHIAVTATLHNSSRVKLEFYDGLFVAQKLAPLEDEDAYDLHNESFNDISNERFGNFSWPTLEESRYSWEKDDLIVEPGEARSLTFEFMVGNEIKAVLITTYLYNERAVGRLSATFGQDVPSKRKRRLLRWQEVEGPMGWIRTSTYDIT